MRPPSLFPLLLAAASAFALASAGCRDGERREVPPAATASQPPVTAAVAPPSAPRARVPAPVRTGGALARGAGEEALYLADEDQGNVLRIGLPLDPDGHPRVVKMPGPPAAVLPLDGRVLVTVRGVASDGPNAAAPGLLLLLRPDAAAGLVEAARVALPADAWGVAVTPDEKVAVVTSAWTHQVSGVDLERAVVLWTVDVGREPRGVVVRADGDSAYVTHLVRATLTRLDRITSSAPVVREVPFPAAPLRTVRERADAATLAYAPVLSPDGARLYVARQALGATGKRAWNGQATVDVLLTGDDTPLARPPSQRHELQTAVAKERLNFRPGDRTLTGPGPTQLALPFAQPRAAVFVGGTRTLLVASEGTDALAQLDALAIDPSARPLATLDLGLAALAQGDARPPGQTHCGAPTGLALSADESVAYVFCRSTHGLTFARLGPGQAEPASRHPTTLSLGPDALPEQAALGRRLFYDASDRNVSGGYACNGCHPEGRDDGHVWHEDEALVPREARELKEKDARPEFTATNLHAYELTDDSGAPERGAPRQTPMLAGRVNAVGPYGWKGRSPNLRHRVVSGFRIHRWGPDGFWAYGEPAIVRAEALAAFVRQGLVEPPVEAHPPTPAEERGAAVFRDPNVGCAECHVPRTEYTHRGVVGLGDWPVDLAHFDPESEHGRFKTPSLLHVGGTPPYFHDGSEPTLEALVEHNGNRMGHTKQLPPADRQALVAFLRTL